MPERLTRRRFLMGLGASLLAGCTFAPGTGGWPFVTWAEGLYRRLFTAGPLKHRLVKEYPRSAISKSFPIRSLSLPSDYAAQVATWRLKVGGLVENPAEYSMTEFQRAFEKVGHVTRHDCVEGWSAIAEFTGVRLADLMAAVKPKPEARYVVFYSADFDPAGKAFYGSLGLEEATHPQTVLAYEMNGAPLTIAHGAPLRLRVPNQLGYKSTKFIHGIAFVASLEGLGGGKGGYWEDSGYEHYAGI